MAKPKFSGIAVVDMQNSVSDTTFSRNAYGTYTKAKLGSPTPTSYLTAWQVIVGSLYFDWQNILSDSDRAKWYGLYIPRRNNMAEVNRINGFDAFLSVNLNLALIPLPPIYLPVLPYNPPQPPDTPQFGTVSALALEVITATPNPFPVMVYLSKQLSPGRMSLNQITAFIGYVPVNSGYQDFIVAYTARFGAPVTGRKIFAKVFSLDPNTGYRGSITCFSAIVT